MRLGLIGYPLDHSLSPAMHNRALREVGLLGEYLLLPTPPEALAGRMAEVRAGFWGVNVTVPHKEAVLPYLDGLSPEARAIGAVNTIVREGEKLIGHNTDAPGFLRGLEEAGLLFEPALVLGAGGAGRAVAYALKGRGLDVYVWNRTPGRARALAEEMGLREAPLEFAREARLLVNATRVGLMDPEATPLPPDLLPREGGVVDLVYRPLWTRLLREARARGLRVQHGLYMLVYQGALAFRLWTGREAPVAAMFQAACEALSEPICP
ncbi:shikimate dehydrogenase [Thermus filiformis]|uniref:Shikimate dehydrogenase (NADP(+)) n=1 Tax=Thermus filiformis TaxID=276 RepID=A0A0D6XCC6_THEFI|nr:shikimate dehydrogenase [Thermus filiformis]KIX84513.1 shikimate dehydrogenase [Thermus filiformis]